MYHVPSDLALDSSKGEETQFLWETCSRVSPPLHHQPFLHISPLPDWIEHHPVAVRQDGEMLLPSPSVSFRSCWGRPQEEPFPVHEHTHTPQHTVKERQEGPSVGRIPVKDYCVHHAKGIRDKRPGSKVCTGLSLGSGTDGLRARGQYKGRAKGNAL